MIKTLHFLVLSLSVIRALHFPCSFLVANRVLWDFQGGEHSIQYKEYLENSSDAIATVLPTEEPEYSFSMGYEHPSTNPETESDEVIESSVKNLVQIPSTSYLNPLFDDEEINSDKVDPHYFNAESDLIESLSNHDTLIDSSPKFDYLEEFSVEFMPTSIVNEKRIKIEHEEYINLMEKLSAINSFPQHSIQYKEYLENSSDAIATVLPTEEPEYSFSMGYEHPSTNPETKTDEVIESSVKNLVQIPSTSYLNPLFDDEEINSDKVDPHYFNAESDLIESLSNHDTLIDSSPKFDYLEEFSGEFMPLSIVNEEHIKREHGEYISLMEKLLAINSFPRLLENFHANSIIENLPTSPIPVEDSDSLRKRSIFLPERMI
nr:hypothetical protein [Tanacetum cinerariifolium]